MRRSILLLTLVAAAACSRQEAPPAARPPVSTVVPAKADVGGTVTLPKQVGSWIRPDAGKRVTAETIFDYMDGGGELYLAYRFDSLSVFEYASGDASAGTILVELYRMRTPDDAFGLLSNDWGGEAPSWDRGPAVVATPANGGLRQLWPHRSLYGAGLLRVWAGDLYARVLASRETPESRTAVLALGQAISESREPESPPQKPSALPAVLSALPASAGGLAIRPDRTVFFRSHLVLNAAYFLASQDILGLGLDVDGVTTEYRPPAAGGRPIRVILVRYPTAGRAGTGLASFVRAYLPEAKGVSRATGAAHVEHGWVAWSMNGEQLVVALDAADERAAQSLAGAIARQAAAVNDRQ